MDYRRGDIVLVNFNPQKKDGEVGKIRPAIIISDSELNEILDLITVIPLTTNIIRNSEPLRVLIQKRDKLEKSSDAMIEQLRNVAKSRVGEKLSELTESELEKIEFGIKEMLSL